MKYVLDSCVALAYVTLAEREACKHLTADDRLIRAAPAEFSIHHVFGIPSLDSNDDKTLIEGYMRLVSCRLIVRDCPNVR